MEKLFHSFLLKYQASNIYVTLSLLNVTLSLPARRTAMAGGSKGDLKRDYSKQFKSWFDMLTMTSMFLSPFSY
jgi:hypothetical protein